MKTVPAGRNGVQPAPDPPDRGAGVMAAVLYVVFLAVSCLQQPGLVTYDTRAELTERPGDFLSGAFTLWHAGSNFGEFQNQAYGLLFPQGAWFWAADRIGMADWVAQRLWTGLLVIAACEGARRVGRHLGLAPAAALVAGMAYALSPRLLGTVGVQTGESLPGVLMPWLVLAIVLHLRGRIGVVGSVLLSGAAVVAMGGVNAVETAGSLPLAVILVGWAGWHRWVSWRYVVAWVGTVGAACVWWALPLLMLARYSPPFYDFVESASNTTGVIGWSEALRGDSSWLGSLMVGSQAWWPAAFHLAHDPVLVIVAGVVAAVGLAGLLTVGPPWRGPLVTAAVLGLTCLTLAHVAPEGSPLAGAVRSLLDGPLAMFRNVHKIDPIVRLPLALGAAAALAHVARAVGERAAAFSPRLSETATLALLVPALGVLVLGQPFLLGEGRTPGWEQISKPWTQARDYLAARQDGTTTLVVPGSGFAIQDWGWTLDEPLAILGGANVAAHTQTPLIPGESIRYLSSLDELIGTGQATGALSQQLARAGIGHVVLRRDSDRTLTGSADPGSSAVSLATAGLRRDAAFGTADAGPAVEIFDVPGTQAPVRITDDDDVTTVRGAPESVLDLEDGGLVAPDQATVLENEPGWPGKAQVVTDGLQRRERAFGSTDESLSAVLGADEPWRIDRRVHDYPAGVGPEVGGGMVVAQYDGLRSLTASSAQGYADNFGAVVPQSGPYAAVDGNRDTRWLSSPATDPRQQWLRMEFSKPRSVDNVTVAPVADDPAVVPIREIEVVAGRQRVRAAVGPSGAPVTLRLSGASVGSVEIRTVRVATAAAHAQVGLREVTVDDAQVRRTLRLPGVVPQGASVSVATGPERRACSVTIGIPDCSDARSRPPEEAVGLDRSYVSAAPQSLRISGTVVARSSGSAAALLDPVESDQHVEATSFYGSDPKVAARFAYDGQPTTSWVSAAEDKLPTLRFHWSKVHTVRALTVAATAAAGAPTVAVVTAGGRTQRVALHGGAVSALKPVRTKSLSVRFERDSDGPVVVPEISFRGVDVTRPLLADTPTGAVCGLGPRVYVDGTPMDTRVHGTMADIINGSPMRLDVCHATPGSLQGHRRTVRLEPGEHRIAGPPSDQFEITGLTAVPRQQADAPPAGGAERQLDVRRWSDSGGDLSVEAGPAAVIWMPQNFNPGWRAVATAADGSSTSLTALRVDGWAQAWRIPASATGLRVRIDFPPQHQYAVVLVAGLAVSGAVLVGGLISLFLLTLPRFRRRTSTEPRPWRMRDSSDWARAAAFSTLVVAVLLLLGPAATVGMLLGAALSVRSHRSLTALMVVLAAGAALLDGLANGVTAGRAADVAAAVAVGLLAGAVAAPRPRGRHR